jgi:hypothetical protein
VRRFLAAAAKDRLPCDASRKATTYARGVATNASNDATLSLEAKLLVYFFALGAQNMTGLGRGDEWAADGATGDGARGPEPTRSGSR